MPGTRRPRSGLSGARSIRRSILSTAISASGVTGRRAPGCPCGLPSHLQAGGPWMGWCNRAETGSCPNGARARRSVHVVRSGHCARGLLLEEGEKRDPEVSILLRSTRRSSATVAWSYVSVTDQVALEAQSLHQGPDPKIRSETAPGLDNLVHTLPFGAGHPEVTSLLLRQVALRHIDQDAFSTLPVRESSRQ